MATITVGSGKDHATIQAAVNAAAAGDTIAVDPGTYAETITIPTTQHGTPVLVTTAGLSLPNRRMTAADASGMAVLRPGGADQAQLNGEGIKGWIFRGLSFENTISQYSMVVFHNASLGGGAYRNCDNITFDRCVMIGGTVRQALYIHGGNYTVSKCHIANIAAVGTESKAILCHDGPGPYRIDDNYLEAASINVLFGGADQSSANHIPTNISFTNNYCFKKPSWEGAGYGVKNLFELKCAKNVTITDNTFENNYVDGQNGYGILFTVRNDGNNSPWSTVQDVLFERNVVTGSPSGVNFLGLNDGSESVQGTRVTVRNNYFSLSGGKFMTVGGEFGTLVVDHNTVVGNSQHLMIPYESGQVWDSGGQRLATFAAANLTFTNNLCYSGEFGIQDADGQGFGTTALTADFTAYNFSYNVIASTSGNTFPALNTTVAQATIDANINTDRYLVPGSAYAKAGSDGRDVGQARGTGLALPITMRFTRPVSLR